MTMSMLPDPKDIKEKAKRLWLSQTIPKKLLGEGEVFPLVIPWRRPPRKAYLENFALLKEQIAKLKRESDLYRKLSYSIDFREQELRKLGVQNIPQRIYFKSCEQYLGYTGFTREYKELLLWRQCFRTEFPTLVELLHKKPLLFVRAAAIREQILQVLRSFSNNPRPDCYVRELQIPGVDTKFIEQNRGLLYQLLATILPEVSETPPSGSTSLQSFNTRFGLRSAPSFVRIRLLDDTILKHVPFRELSVTTEALASNSLEVQRVFIVENEQVGLSFPRIPNSILIYGMGYAVTVLQAVDWLQSKATYYWGDIDTHGFAILSALRTALPGVVSFAMDETTLKRHQALWGQEEKSKRFLGKVSGLNQAESIMLERLQSDFYATALRLEQERICPVYVRSLL